MIAFSQLFAGGSNRERGQSHKHRRHLPDLLMLHDVNVMAVAAWPG